MKHIYREWLLDQRLNSFITLTFKQGLPLDSGVWERLSEDHIRKSVWLFRDRLAKRLLGKRRRLLFLPFAEGDGLIKRHHVHILLERPEDVTTEELVVGINRAMSGLDWIHDVFDVRTLDPGTAPTVISYSLKEGTKAFIAEACSFV